MKPICKSLTLQFSTHAWVDGHATVTIRDINYRKTEFKKEYELHLM